MSDKSITARLRAGLKGLLWGEERAPWSFGLMRPGVVDYAAEVGDLMLARVVMVCVNWMTGAFPQARFVVQRLQADGQLGTVGNRRLTELLVMPNPDYGGLLLWAPTILCYTLNGNAYWRVEWNTNHTKVLHLYY